jgi:hypothetical protein
MADNIDLQVIAPTAVPGSCVDPYLLQLMGQIRVLFPAQFSLILIGPNEPTVEQRAYVWVKTDSITDEITGIFTWSPFYGIWLYPYASPPESSERRLWVGTELSLETFDGGESATVSATTGPFWEKDDDFDDQVLTGAGTPAVGVNQAFGTTGANYSRRGIYIIKRTARKYVRSA